MELKELNEKAKNYLLQMGFGTGSNLTVNTAVSLMVGFALEFNSNEPNESQAIGNNEKMQKKCELCNSDYEYIILHVCSNPSCPRSSTE